MTNAVVHHIEIIIESGVLSDGLVDISANGATSGELAQLETLVGRPLCEDHRALLLRWNGADLDVVRILPVASTSDRESIVSAFTYIHFPPRVSKPIPLASDPAGFVYYETESGEVWVWDHDGGSNELVATDVREFFTELVFGRRASEFIDQQWHEELVQAGILKRTGAP
jgi:hypothetical protein